MSELPEIERFEIGPDGDHPGFSEMHTDGDGRWVLHSDHLQALTQQEVRIKAAEHERDEAHSSAEHWRERAEKAESQLADVQKRVGAEIRAMRARGVEYQNEAKVSPSPESERLDAHAATNLAVADCLEALLTQQNQRSEGGSDAR